MTSQPVDKKRGTAERRSAILAAARTLFSSQGYEKTTMQQVVREAGTSIGNCYFYFNNKEALLRALVEEITHEIKVDAEKAVARMDGEVVPRLAVSLHILFAKVLENSAISRLILLGLAQPTLREATFAYYTAALLRFFEEHPNLLPEMDSELLVEAWLGGCAAVLEAAVTGDIDRDPHEISRFLVGWNLRASGVASADVDAGLAALDRFVAEHA